MTWIIWVILALIAVVLYLSCRYETVHDKRRRGYIVFNKTFQNPAYDGRIFWTLRSAERARRRMQRNVNWVTYQVYKVV